MEDGRHSNRTNRHDKTCCILCSKGNEPVQLHGYNTHSAEKSLRSMVEEMNDYELCAKIGGGDLVALEAKFHTSCLMKYRTNTVRFLEQNAAAAVEATRNCEKLTELEHLLI